MNTLIRLKKTTPVFVIAFVLAWFALSPTAQAVVPPPDGGYPGFNTAEGQNALLSLTTGSANTAVGWSSLSSNAEGSFNTATGAGSLLFNTGDANTAFGAAALLFNGTGRFNTAVGTAALLNNIVGAGNTAVGANALFSNFGNGNDAFGSDALFSNSTGTSNTAFGGTALPNNTTGSANTAMGQLALYWNSTGNNNTAIGTLALLNATGSGNTALGVHAGENITSGSNNIHIGNAGLANDDAFIRIGTPTQTKCAIAGIRDVTTAIADAIPVVIDSTYQLGTQSSSRRFKKEIKPMDKASEDILALKPVTFHYKSDKKDTPQFGLIAEEVAAVNPDLVVRDKNGEIYTVRYDAVNAMLLNEFLREHRTVQEQGATIARLQKQIEALTEGLQKVSAQLEASKPAPQVVNNP